MEHLKSNEENIQLGTARLMVETQLTHAEIQLDSERGTARIEDRVFALTRLELEILAYLAQHGGVVSQEELVLRVTHGTYNPTSSVIRVHVSHLRHKLGIKGIIETVRGRGFRLSERWGVNEGMVFANRPSSVWSTNGHAHEGPSSLEPMREELARTGSHDQIETT